MIFGLIMHPYVTANIRQFDFYLTPNAMFIDANGGF